jgi:integrase
LENGRVGSISKLSGKRDEVHVASKGKSGRVVPLNKQLHANLVRMLSLAKGQRGFALESAYVITTERSDHTSAQAVVNMFKRWYHDLGLLGCSSHSGRRTFITNAARQISTVGGSIRDVQMLAGHSSLAVTQRYIEGDSEARKKIVDLI